MTLVSSGLVEGVRKLRDMASSPGVSGSVAKPQAVVKLVGPQTSVATVDGFSVTSDEPEWLGGRGGGPTPSALFCASIGFAEGFVFARLAAIQGVDFDSFETKVEGHWDMKGMFGIDGKESAVMKLLIDTWVASQAPVEKVADVLKLLDARCPMTATVVKSARLERRLWVNGREVDIS